MSPNNLNHPFDDQVLFTCLAQRFQQYPERHPNIVWQDVLSQLQTQPEKIKSLHWMEETGGEPDLI